MLPDPAAQIKLCACAQPRLSVAASKQLGCCVYKMEYCFSGSWDAFCVVQSAGVLALVQLFWREKKKIEKARDVGEKEKVTLCFVPYSLGIGRSFGI